MVQTCAMKSPAILRYFADTSSTSHSHTYIKPYTLHIVILHALPHVYQTLRMLHVIHHILLYHMLRVMSCYCVHLQLLDGPRLFRYLVQQPPRLLTGGVLLHIIYYTISYYIILYYTIYYYIILYIMVYHHTCCRMRRSRDSFSESSLRFMRASCCIYMCVCVCVYTGTVYYTYYTRIYLKFMRASCCIYIYLYIYIFIYLYIPEVHAGQLLHLLPQGLYSVGVCIYIPTHTYMYIHTPACPPRLSP